jgi:deoxyribose-phosphate aldolase
MGPASTKNLAPRSAAATMTLPPHLADAGADEAALRRFLFGLPGVDPVG